MTRSLADLRDVQQAVPARQQLHDGAEIEQAQHRALAIPPVNEATPTPIKVDPTATASPVREATPTATATPPVIEATPTAEPAGATIEPATPEMVLVEAGSFKMGSTKGLGG